ncbi:serine/threonine/tyrosine-interacting-like protein 2 [Hypomesus transpacificus]|uniref:serine/threonine/tyrosine-interacting-like protein 2 n=1 Tax=Hypomesus transpacificus TaxID=137520 RepID=UPI001F076219|nr:serine/threonine/tyrosine-interacting-like protein 2 [Hypomesus transpacificus]XP_046887385.1 serine/threonine/tyrosine-interacting-like protein 2 [Hypomesus transpacificus]
MASPSESPESGDQTVPSGEEDTVRSIQSHYLRSPSPSNFSTISESRFSMISGSDAESIFMEPIHLSSAIAAKQIISEELKPRRLRTESIPESMLETAEQLMVEDLYNRVKDMIDDRSPYNTPCVMDIQRAMVQDRLEAPFSPVDEVWSNIFIGEKSVAVNKGRLKRLGITHILNAAHGTGVYTGEAFYAGMNIQYMGIEVDDFADVDISPHFRTAAEFLDEALLTHKGKVLVDSMMGVSRSAVLVAAYLMIFHHMTIMEALTALRNKRAINPNEGFLKQLRQLNEALLEERDDDDDTLSQCSVIDALARLDEEPSMMGVKAQSIMMEEEEDGASVMSSVASSSAALLPSPAPDPSGGGGQGGLGGTEALMEKENEEEDDVASMIREWQRRNEKYQNEEWWEAQLQSDGEEEGEEGGSLSGGGRPCQPAVGEDLESVTSEEVRALRERVKGRVRRRDCDSQSSCSSYSDLWKQRLKEIEEQAAARYRSNNDNSGGSTNGEQRSLDEDVESVMSDTSSMYNFCKRNKDKMTPLERWRVKRIQFGWNKKDGAKDGGAAGGGGGGGEAGEREVTPFLDDVNLTAYQSWKLKQQKRLGEDNKDDIVELSRGDDSATVKRRQRREELLERSRRTLEESQSMCGWDTESSLSGSNVPLSAFWAGAGVTTAGSDDNISMLSGRSSVVSQSRSVRSQPLGLPLTPVPIVPVPTVPGPGGEPMVNLASIQNWIANVVTDTLNQKQAEMSLPPSRAGSVLSFDGGSSLYSGRGAADDKASVLSGVSYSSSLSNRHGPAGGASSLSGLGSRRNKITTTSVPLYSLFQDQVDLHKLDLMDKEIKSDMRDKMASYEVKKIAEDNKRSTLYKKKPKEEEKDEEEEDNFSPGKTSKGLRGDTSIPKKPTRSYGLSGRLNLSTALERDKNTSIDEWLNSVRPPQRRQEGAERATPGSSSTLSEGEDEDEEFTSPYQFRRRADTESSPDHSPEPYHPARRSPTDKSLSNSSSRAGGEDGDESQADYSAKRKFTHYSQYRELQDGRGGGEREERGRRGGGGRRRRRLMWLNSSAKPDRGPELRLQQSWRTMMSSPLGGLNWSHMITEAGIWRTEMMEITAGGKLLFLYFYFRLIR